MVKLCNLQFVKKPSKRGLVVLNVDLVPSYIHAILGDAVKVDTSGGHPGEDRGQHSDNGH